MPALVGGVLALCCCCSAWGARRFPVSCGRGAGAAANAPAASECARDDCSAPAAFGALCERHAPKCATDGCARPFAERSEHQTHEYCPLHACDTCGGVGVYNVVDSDDGEVDGDDDDVSGSDTLPQLCEVHAPRCGWDGCTQRRPRAAARRRDAAALYCARHQCVTCGTRVAYFLSSGGYCDAHWPLDPARPLARVLWRASKLGRDLVARRDAARTSPALSLQDHPATPADSATGSPPLHSPGVLTAFDAIVAARSPACSESFADVCAALAIRSGAAPSAGARAARCWVNLGQRCPKEVWARTLAFLPPPNAAAAPPGAGSRRGRRGTGAG